MLNVPAPFPLPGSFALLDHEGQRRLARIIARNPDGSAVVSLPERPDAGGTLSVPPDGLIDGTPLSGDEQAELNRLAVDLHPFLCLGRRARTQRQKQALARHRELRERLIHARLLAGKVARFEQARRDRIAA